MNRPKIIILALLLGTVSALCSANGVNIQEPAPGVFKLTWGTPDRHTPYGFAATSPLIANMQLLPQGGLPFPMDDIKVEIHDRGCRIEIPMFRDEEIYGFGMQIGSLAQKGLKKKPIVNDHPLNNLGYTHAPQTFYVSDKGYGILVNTLRYTTFYCGTNKKIDSGSVTEEAMGVVHISEEDLYRNERSGSYMYIDVPHAHGVEIFVFAGNNLLDVVQRYNLFSGGGCLPPLWGLGLKYRTKTDFTQEKTLLTAKYFREKNIPCDVIGLEPGWQTAAYSCSYVWNTERFPDYREMISQLAGDGFHVNLWEHAYVHPTSPIHEALEKYSGDFLVWNGLVPDFSLTHTREIFNGYHRTFMEQGVSGFKLDECDNSNIASGEANWGFPEMSVFPSGMDGEQMHQAFGSLYVSTLDELFRSENLRTYQDYRSSGMFMSSVPAVLYSDIYDQDDYLLMMSTAAFGGLLWSPEVRRAASESEFFHRLQASVLSPVTTVNSWFLENPPWMQYDRDKNNRGEFLPNIPEMEDNVRKLIGMRMSLIPYLYSAFADYAEKGIPPFRPLVMDFPEDARVKKLADQYMVGRHMMAAPLTRDIDRRTVYFPEGIWYDFNTLEKYTGGREYEISTAFCELPLYVREGAIVPLARPCQNITAETVFDLHVNVYGKPSGTFNLREDDGLTYDYLHGEFNDVALSVENGHGKVSRQGNYTKGCRYKITNWNFIE